MISQEDYNELRSRWEFEQGPKDSAGIIIEAALLALSCVVLGGVLGACVTRSYYNTFVGGNPELQSIQIEQAENQLHEIERKIEHLKKTNAKRDRQP